MAESDPIAETGHLEPVLFLANGVSLILGRNELTVDEGLCEAQTSRLCHTP